MAMRVVPFIVVALVVSAPFVAAVARGGRCAVTDAAHGDPCQARHYLKDRSKSVLPVSPWSTSDLGADLHADTQQSQVGTFRLPVLSTTVTAAAFGAVSNRTQAATFSRALVTMGASAVSVAAARSIVEAPPSHHSFAVPFAAPLSGAVLISLLEPQQDVSARLGTGLSDLGPLHTSHCSYGTVEDLPPFPIIPPPLQPPRTLCTVAGAVIPPSGGWSPCPPPAALDGHDGLLCRVVSGPLLLAAPRLALDLVHQGTSGCPEHLFPQGPTRESVTPTPPIAPQGGPQLALVLLFAAVLCSSRSAAHCDSFLPSLLALSVVAMFATASACSHAVASSGETVTVCATPWPHTPINTPTVGTVVTVTLELSRSFLIATEATVNGVDVLASFTEVADGLYTVMFDTPAGDELWPWTGLELHASLSDGSAAIGFSAVVVPGSTWSEESATRGMGTLATSNGRGVCMGDVDGDGDVDVFVAMRSGAQNQLWINNGSGAFEEQATAWGVAGDVSSTAVGCGFGDADGDGLLDLMVTRYSNHVNELYMNTGSEFVEDGVARGVADGDNSLGLSWGDVDGDGDVDVFVCADFNTANLLYVNDGGGAFFEEGSDRGIGLTARNSQQSAMVDIDGDGYLDVLVVNDGAANELHVNDGGGAFVDVGAARGFSDSGTGQGLSVGDWSGDGVVDLYVSNWLTRDLLYRNGGGGLFVEVGRDRGVGASTGGGRGVSMLDIEGDGDLDIVVGVGNSGADLVWVNDGHGGFTDDSGGLMLGSSASVSGVAAGDIDGDGDVDVIMFELGGVYVNHNGQPGVSRVVVVRPLTAGGAQSAFGATVGVICVEGCSEAWVGVRIVDGGSSLYSQSGYDAVVGVPVPSATYNVSVRWGGDFHPVSSWATHPRLGGIVPSLLTAPGSRLFVVRPLALVASVGIIPPWDYPTELAPATGDSMPIPIVLSPSVNTHDVSVSAAVLNGQDVSGGWVVSSPGEVLLTYVTEAGSEGWPWEGLDIEVGLVDSGGLVSSVSASVIPGSTWSEESAARGMWALGNPLAHGACMGDVDGDGDVDVFVAMRSGAQNQLWINDGSGAFEEQATAWGVAGNASSTAVGCGFGDADGDGLLDLMVTRFTDDVNELYMNTGSEFVEEGDARGVGGAEASVGLSWGDVDGDGDVDVFVCADFNTANLLYVNDGGGAFFEEGSDRGFGLTARSSQQSAMVDIDGDGYLDVLVVNNGAANELYVNDGGGAFVDVGAARGFSDSGTGQGLSVGDWSGDGVVDLYVSNWLTRDLLYWNGGGGFFVEVGRDRGLGASTQESRGVSMFDFESDGDLDIAVGHLGNGDIAWVNDGNGGFTDGSGDLALGSLAGSSAMAVGDIDGDGDLDVVASLSGGVYVNHNGQPDFSRAVVVRPLTAGGAQSAFGATVGVGCVAGCGGGWVGVRVIDGGSGYFSQNGYDAVVGVPVPSATYNVSVRWGGDFHPVSSWATHPRLGGIVPSLLTTPSSRLFAVRPEPVSLSVGNILPWDFPAVAYRTGDPSPPSPGDTVIVPITAPRTAGDLSVVSAAVNGQDVRLSFRLSSPGVYTLEYTTVVGQEAWPWVGLDVEVTVVDSCGLTSSHTSSAVPGTTLAPALSSTGFATLPPSSAGLCVGDVDGDGDADMVVADSDAEDLLFVNTGGVFTVSAGAFPGSAATSGCALGDADGDGDLDVFFAVDGTDRLFVQSLVLNFSEEAVGAGPATAGNSRGAGWGDVNADGFIDLFVCVNGGLNALHANDGSGRFTDVTVSAGVATAAMCEQAMMVDVDGDSDLDILVVNGIEPSELFLNAGWGNFLERSNSRGFTAMGDSRSLAAGDVNGDGHTDIAIAQASSATLLFVNDGGGVFSEEGAVRGMRQAVGATGSTFVDLDHDGDVDVVVGRSGGLPAVVLGNGGTGLFSDRSADVGVGTTSALVAVLDFDSDGDLDLVFGKGAGVYESFAADGGVANWLKVRPLTPAGGQSAFGAVARVACVEGCALPWSGVRVIDGGGGLHGQHSYDAHVGLPMGGTAFDVEVVFVGGATHDMTTDPALGGVSPGSVVEVIDRPYVTGVTAVYSDSGAILGMNDTVTVTVTAGQQRTDLAPGPGCCLLNGVNVVQSFMSRGDGSYSLTYVLREGDGEWEAGALLVIPTLQSVGRNLSMVEVEYALEGSPAGDPVPPVVEFGCRPGAASANVYELVCVSCPSELSACTFSYLVNATSQGPVAANVLHTNYTSPTSASFVIGPFDDTDFATLTVFAVDGAGNVGRTEGLSWRVDTSSPVTTLVTKPDPVTRHPDAAFGLQCSEVGCSFEYRFNGGPLTALGGNATAVDVPVVDTTLTTAPARVSSVATPSLSFSMSVSERSMWAGASVGVEVAGMTWTLPVVNNETEVLQLPVLSDGEHVLVAVGGGGDGTSDATPVEYVFTVDTTPPTVSVLDAPVDGERGRPGIVVDADEDDCVFEWRAGPLPLDASWTLTSSARIVPEVASSTLHTFEVRAIDPAGNVGTTVSTSWTPAACPDGVPDVVVTSDVGVSVGQRYVTFDVAGGVAWDAFEYSFDGGDWTPSTSTKIFLDGVGLGLGHELRLRAAVPSVCNAQLADSRPTAHTVAWTEPGPLPPQVTMLTKPTPSTPDVFPEFELLGSRRLAWFEYSLDGDPWTPTDALLRVGPLQAGGHTMRVRAVDGDGVSSGDVQSHSWTITAASDSSIVLTNLPDGQHSLLVMATDEAGSLEVAPRTYVWRVDTTPPVIVANRTSPRFSSSRTAVIDVSCEGEIDPCDFCWTSDTVAGECSPASPLLVTAPEDGFHVVDVRAVDSVGLESVLGVGIEWTADSTPPAVSVDDVDGVLLPPRYVTDIVDFVLRGTSLRLGLTASEDVLGFDVVLNGFAWGAVGSMLELNDLPAIVNGIVVSGTDPAGNVGEGVVLHVLVDVTPPETLPFTALPPAYTNAFAVGVGVDGADSVGGSGVDMVEVSLTDDGGHVVDVVVVDGASGTAVFANLTTGVFSVTAVAADVAGNVDGTGVVAMMVVDHEAPVSQFVEAVPGFVAAPTLTVWVAASEEGVTFARVAGVISWQPANASGAVTFSGLIDGSHVVELRSVDVAGNAEMEPYVHAAVVVDTMPPVLFWTADVEPFTNLATSFGCFAANDTNEVSFSASPPSVVVGSDHCFEVDVAVDGDVVVEITGVDAAGNVGEVLATSWVLDRVPPSTVVLSSIVDSSPACVHGDVTVCGAASSAMLGIACDDGSPSVAVSPCRPQYAVSLVKAAVAVGCAAPTSTRRRLSTDGFVDAPTLPFTLDTVDGDGKYAVAVRSADSVGNVETGNTTLTWFVDTVAPATAPTLVQTPDKVVSSTTALFVIQLSDDNSPGQTAFFFKLDDGVEAQVLNLPSPNSASVQLEVSGLEDGDHKVEVWARDQAGNDGPFVLYDWAIVTEAPGVNILSTPAPVSADARPSFVFQAVWPTGATSWSGVEPLAGIEVSLSGATTFIRVCEDTAVSGGLCTWNASLVDTGVGTYTVNVRAVLGGNTGDPTSHTWSYTLCDDDQYAVVGGDGGIECFACPPGGNCAGGLTGQADIAAVQGFWAPPGSTGERFYECPVEAACLPGREVVVGNVTTQLVSQCAEGYTGTLCAVCEDGFFEQFGVCEQCVGTEAVSTLIPVLVGLGIAAVGTTMWVFRSILPRQTIKIGFTMTQIVALGSSAYAIPWPPAFADFLSVLQIFLMDILSVTRAQCAQPMSYFESSVLTFVLYKLVLLGVLLGTWLWHAECVRKLRHSWREQSKDRRMAREAMHRVAASVGSSGSSSVGGQASPTPVAAAPTPRRRGFVAGTLQRTRVTFVSLTSAQLWAPVFRALFFFLFITYGGMTLRVLQMFKCVEVEGEHWLVADMRLQCYTGEWAGYAVYATIMGLTFVLGLPLSITIILCRNRKRLDDPEVLSMWGFLYEKYGTHVWLWEVEQLTRRLVMTAIPLLLADGSAFQVALAVMVSGWAHVMHAVWKPWGAGTPWYYLQHGALTTISFVFLMGLLFKVDSVSHDSTTFHLLSWLMIVLSVATLGACVLYAALECVRGLKQRRANRVQRRRPPTASAAAAAAASLPADMRDRVAWVARNTRAPNSGPASPESLSWQSNPLRAPGGKSDKSGE